MATYRVLQKAWALMQLVKTTTTDAPTETTYRVVARVSPFSERTVAFDLTPDHTVADAAARLGFAAGMTYQAWIFDQPLDQSKAQRFRPTLGCTSPGCAWRRQTELMAPCQSPQNAATGS